MSDSTEVRGALLYSGPPGADKLVGETFGDGDGDGDSRLVVCGGRELGCKQTAALVSEAQKTGVWSDVAFNCQNGSLRAHRLVLAGYSHLLGNLFSAGPADDTFVVHLPDVEVCHMTTVLRFLYEGEVRLGGGAAEKRAVLGLLETLGVQNNYAVGPVTAERKQHRLRIKHENNLSSRKPAANESSKQGGGRKKRTFMASLDPSELTCNVCCKKFPALYKLKIHQLIHSDTFPFICSSCGKGFNNKYKMHVHEKKHLKVPPAGAGAAAAAATTETVSSCMQEQQPPAPTKKQVTYRPCKQCPEQFTTVRGLKSHVQIFHGNKEKYPCPQCPTMCRTLKNLRTHLKVVHNDSESQLRFACPTCGKRFLKPSHLEDHAARHNPVGQFACMFCPKRCATKQDLDRHLSSHRGEANFRCQYCGRSFVHRKTYTQHVRKHLGHKPYLCKPCQKSFALLTTLKKHQASHQRKGDNTRVVTAVRGARGAQSCIESCDPPDVGAEESPEAGIEQQQAKSTLYIPGPHYIQSSADASATVTSLQVITDYAEISRIGYDPSGGGGLQQQQADDYQFEPAVEYAEPLANAQNHFEGQVDEFGVDAGKLGQINRSEMESDSRDGVVFDFMGLFSPAMSNQTETPLDKL